MMRYTEALAHLEQEARLQPVEVCPLIELGGRVLAEAVTTRVAVPSFNNSAMDGFALQASWTSAVRPEAPLTLSVSDCLAAGDHPLTVSGEGVVEIMTGAPLPGRLDAVVQIEKVVCQRDTQGRVLSIGLDRPVKVGENIRYQGEDFLAGLPLLGRGIRLEAAAMAALAATGLSEAKVFRKPRIGLMASGKEVSDTYGQPLAVGEIYNSNIPYLAQIFRAGAYPTTYLGNMGDDSALFARWLNECRDCEILISSGAVSKGKWDFIPHVLREQGARVVFHGVAIKPGKPVLFAVLPDGRYFFGLPGNPVSAAVGARFFVQPLLRAMMGMPPEQALAVPLSKPYAKQGALRHFLKARLNAREGSGLVLDLLDGQESFRIAPLLDMNGWAVLTEEHGALAAGETVSWLPTALFPVL